MPVNGNGLECTRRAKQREEGENRKVEGEKRQRKEEREQRPVQQAITMCSGCFGLSVRSCTRPYVCPLSAPGTPAECIAVWPRWRVSDRLSLGLYAL
ncbi:hypothetical protein K0M31_004360 [Melipona bicolor]|uniref:Uncharacterized protein n=1 Tax=Melipona bicolor TaxID=60889 RepID=A0AA40FX48_9HYME|nr:hypothetical protein K0M31_004360 [Melipona bicolor]